MMALISTRPDKTWGNIALDVGERLQSIRKLKGLSQRELAKRAGVTNSTISMIEKNSVSPSISSLRKVLDGIPMSMVEFFSEETVPENSAQVVYKASELIDISDGAVTMKLVGKSHQGRAIAFLTETYPPGADTGEEMLVHEGEETGILVEGRLELVVGLDTYVLEAGDSYYFESTRPHRFRNPFDVPARLISAATPANF
ncbi:HTH-type transcriptional regulator PuuR [Pseudomonas syringae pv. actinidiae]|nr:HTH-type transcriptional regulator PuuR [Pseudomonas syringae pv. actinidiae]OSN45516.1 HTH-type transcriptional regulator PuuR [Pseudomonas syringae pv. actinidiae]OSR44689.1 HTH-type transcriptional regulator PuuR [Pseudomonas syringae pv. actinidiae]OSR45990.1 HTH-type transcriptional regulator PuuR [Pseudomonas syringae pv. actinidiae]OSR46895.1 HTH-type transcriptional regulator PuuR [Pseudomonas syringae pv. actinidiae]